MGFKKITAVFLVIIGLIGLGGILYGLNYLGFLDLKPLVSKVPYIDKIPYLAKALPSKAATQKPEANILELENKHLKNQVKSLEREVKLLTQEKEALAQAKDLLETEFQEIKSTQVEDGNKKINYEQQAQYYGQMKADAAVKIMDNLEDELVIGVFLKMENEQVSKILSKMDPKRAANLVKQMTN